MVDLYAWRVVLVVSLVIAVFWLYIGFICVVGYGRFLIANGIPMSQNNSQPSWPKVA